MANTAPLGIAPDTDAQARLFILSRADRNFVAERRGDANRLGYALQLALPALSPSWGRPDGRPGAIYAWGMQDWCDTMQVQF
jgi:Domain of unknown function (DUF4158)